MTEMWIVASLLLTIWVGVALRGTRYPYKAQQRLFTKAEWRFYQQLDRAIGGTYLIMGKVRIADVLSVKGPKAHSKSWWKAFTRISSKHIDFIICDRTNGTILCGIELDDRSHFRDDRRRRDSFVNGAFDKAGLPLLRFRVQRHGYPPQVLRRAVANAVTSTFSQGDHA